MQPLPQNLICPLLAIIAICGFVGTACTRTPEAHATIPPTRQAGATETVTIIPELDEPATLAELLALRDADSLPGGDPELIATKQELQALGTRLGTAANGYTGYASADGQAVRISRTSHTDYFCLAPRPVPDDPDAIAFEMYQRSGDVWYTAEDRIEVGTIVGGRKTLATPGSDSWKVPIDFGPSYTVVDVHSTRTATGNHLDVVLLNDLTNRLFVLPVAVGIAPATRAIFEAGIQTPNPNPVVVRPIEVAGLQAGAVDDATSVTSMVRRYLLLNLADLSKAATVDVQVRPKSDGYEVYGRAIPAAGKPGHISVLFTFTNGKLIYVVEERGEGQNLQVTRTSY
jgi:hypothetical protein